MDVHGASEAMFLGVLRHFCETTETGADCKRPMAKIDHDMNVLRDAAELAAGRLKE